MGIRLSKEQRLDEKVVFLVSMGDLEVIDKYCEERRIPRSEMIREAVFEKIGYDPEAEPQRA